MRFLAIIPAYNEIDNIESLLRAVFANTPPDAEVLVVDDNSPDGTARIVKNLIPVYTGRLHILNRPVKQGGASVFLQGFSWGTSNGFDVLLAMDEMPSSFPLKALRDVWKIKNLV